MWFLSKLAFMYTTILLCLITLTLSSQPLTPQQTIDLSKAIQADIQKVKIVDNNPSSPKVIKGIGFKTLSTFSDYLEVKSILISDMDPFCQSYLASIDMLKYEDKRILEMYCFSLKYVQRGKWSNFQLIYNNQGGRGSWIGVSFFKKDQNTAEFYSNHLRLAFQLSPDVYILKQYKSNKFLGIGSTSQNIVIEERSRGISREDTASILRICSSYTHNRAIGN